MRGAGDDGGAPAVPKLTAENVAALERAIDDMSARGASGDVQILRGEHRVPPRVLRRGRQPDAGGSLPAPARADRPAPARSLELRGDVRRSIAEHKAILQRRPATWNARSISYPSTSAYRRSGCSSRTTRSRRSDRVRRQSNNREPLIAPDYDLQMLSTCPRSSSRPASTPCGSETASSRSLLRADLAAGGDLAAHVARLGTACMVSSTRNPLYLALEWATLDQISGGRTIFGTGMGNPEEVFGASSRRSASTTCGAAVFEEGLAVLRELWTTGAVTFKAASSTTRTSASTQGPRWARSCRCKSRRLSGSSPTRGSRGTRRRASCSGASRRRPAHPPLRRRLERAAAPSIPELVDQLEWLRQSADEYEADSLVVSYQVTMNIGDRGRGAYRLRRLHLEVLPGAVPGDGSLQLGPGRDA